MREDPACRMGGRLGGSMVDRSNATARAGLGGLLCALALLGALALALSTGAAPAHAAPRKGRHGHHRKKKAPARVTRCPAGQALVRVGKQSFCAAATLPATGNASPAAAAASGALRFEPGKLQDKRRRHAASLAHLLGRRGSKTLKNIEAAIAQGIAKGEALALPVPGRAHAAGVGTRTTARAASAGCGTSLEAEAQREFDEAPQAEKEKGLRERAEAEKSSSFSDGEVQAKVDLERGAIELGIDVKDQGIHIALDLSLCSERNSFKLASCPTAQGAVEGHDEHALEFGMRVTRGKETLLAQSFKLSGETTIKAQTGDDGKLDYFEIKHLDRTQVTLGGSKQRFGPVSLDVAYIGEARIDMRAGGGEPPKPDVAVTMSAAGLDPHERIAVEIELARKFQKAADESFAAEIEKVTKALRGKESIWLEPNKCAQIHFEPDSEALTLQKGASGTFKSRADAKGGGSPPIATWTASAQQNASFSPGGGEGNPLTSNYTVTNAGKGVLVSETLKAVSKAGVAEATWKQKTAKLIGTIAGSFSGRYERTSPEGAEVFEWSGTATFQRTEAGGNPEAASAFKLLSGEATVTASGAKIGTGCQQTGSGQLPLSVNSVWATEAGSGESVAYQIIAPFEFPASVTVTWVKCAEPTNEGQTEPVPIQPAALQSGPAIGGSTSQTSPDGVAFSGSASAAGAANGLDPEESESWSWSFKGSP